LHERIVQVAEGNPLFLEEMLALVRDSGGTQVEVPPTIHALLAARLDQLDPAERSVLEHGAVEGRVFHRGAVAALGRDGDGEVDRRLVALVRKELVRPDRAQLAGDDAYRFRHLLIRDAAYEALPKAARADLHHRFADWLQEHGRSLVELDEIVGYHLEQAARYHEELGRSDVELAEEAADKLAAAGRTALWRGDDRAARSLLERALALRKRADVHLVLDFAESRFTIDLHGGLVAMEEAADGAEKAGDAAGAALARVAAALWREDSGAGSVEEVESLAHAALPLLEAVGDHAGLGIVWSCLASGLNRRRRYDQVETAAEQALRHFDLAGQNWSHPGRMMSALHWGSRPVAEALQRLDVLAERYTHPQVNLLRAQFLAMLDRTDEAQAVGIAAADQFRELKGRSPWFWELDELAGNYEAAAEQLRDFCVYLTERGQMAAFGGYAPMCGRMLCRVGRYDEAEQLAERGRDLADEGDPGTQSLYRRVAAIVAAHRGEHTEAERLAREAVAFSQQAHSPEIQGNAYYDLAEVLETAGRREEAAAAWREALERYERKGIIPLARRTQERLAALQETAT